MNKNVLRLFLAIIILASCSGYSDGKINGRHTVVALMDSAELIMNDNPERAYALMDSIDSSTIHRRSLQARYALLYTEVQYKNYIDETNDSLIMIAVRYYSGKKDVNRRFQSFYYLGCIYYNSHSYTDAAIALSEAEQLSDFINDDYRLGLLYSQLGDVFFQSFDFYRAKEYYQKAQYCYVNADKERHSMYALYDVSRCLMQFNDYIGAHSVLDTVLVWAKNKNDQNLVSYCLISQLTCSLNNNDLDCAKKEINAYLENTSNKEITSLEYSKFAQYGILNEEYTSAISNIQKGWAYSLTKADSIELWYVESLLCEKQGNLNTAIAYYKNSIELQNRNLRIILDQPVVGAQKDYYKTVAELESLKASRNLHLVIFVLIISVFLLIIIRVMTRSRVLKMEAELQDYLLTIKELKLKDDLNDKLVNEKNKRINSLFSNQYAELDEIFVRLIELEASMPDSNQDETYIGINKQRYYKITSSFYKQIHNKLEDFKSPKNQKELKSIVNGNYNNIMDRLAEKNLAISDNDQLIMLFLISGFSPKVVAHIVSDTQKSIYQKRNRIVARIERKSTELSNEVRNILKNSQRHFDA
ncbi:MAG: hypothetical protein J5705_03785 [Bacteroidaceae bacterium]|nr:hypothetical protein [Bacteroidaceae bacterium]